MRIYKEEKRVSQLRLVHRSGRESGGVVADGVRGADKLASDLSDR